MIRSSIDSAIAQVLSGEIDAYEGIVRSYQQDVWKVVAAMLLNAEKTEDFVTWKSVAGVNYSLERSTSLVAPGVFTPIVTSIPSQGATKTYTDTTAPGAGPFFYRVSIGN